MTEPPNKLSDKEFHKRTCSACQKGTPQPGCP